MKNDPGALKKLKKIVGLFSALMLLAMMLAACGNGNNDAKNASSGESASPAAGTPASAGAASSTSAGNQSAPPSAAPESSAKPLNLSIITIYKGEAPQPGGAVEKAIEKYTNTQLDIQWSADLKKKLPVLIASGSLPMAVTFPGSELALPYMVSSVKSGVFWDLTPYIKDYPNLAAIDQVDYQNIMYDSKIYGLPILRPLARGAMTYRADWLKALNLQEPQTLDDLYKIMEAFTTQDPDKDGKNDTYGFLEYNGLNFLRPLAVWLGAPNDWGVQDGKFVYAPTTPAYLEALQFMKKLYDNHIMNQDFAVMEKTAWVSKFEAGKVGTVWNITDTPFSEQSTIQKGDPNAQLDMFGRLPGLNGGPTDGADASNGMVAFPKSSVKTEAQLKQVLSFYNKLGDPQMTTLFNWGLEGVHYKLEDGKAVYIDQGLYNHDVLPFQQKVSVAAVTADNAIEGNEPPLLAKEDEMNRDNEKYMVNDPAIPLVSATYSKDGGQLDKIITDAETKFIMGRIDVDGWNQALEQWRKAGGDKVAEEYTVAYAASQSK